MRVCGPDNRSCLETDLDLACATSCLVWKGGAEHRVSALGLFRSGFVLDYIPMLNKDAVFNAKNISRDPINRCTEPGKPAVHDHEIPVGNNCPRFVSKIVRESFDEVEQSLTARLDMRAVLDVVRRPEPFSWLRSRACEERVKRDYEAS